MTKSTASDAAVADGFGDSVAISGDTQVVGAPRDDNTGRDSGSAYVFVLNQGGVNSWGQVRKLTASDAAEGDKFGVSLSISGDTVVVGALHNDDAGDSSGSAYVFGRNQGGQDNWGQVQKLNAVDAAVGDLFGTSVSISGDTIVVTALLDDDVGDGSGSAYVFERSQGGVDNWSQVRKLTAADGTAGDEFGVSVAISGDTVVVGSSVDDDAGDRSGSAYVFSRNQGGVDNWGQAQKLTASDASTGDEFGRSVAVHQKTLVVGAYLDNLGSAYVFSRDEGEADNWLEIKKLIPPDGLLEGNFGLATAVSGDTAVIGAFSDDDAGNHSGSAYVFLRDQGGADNWGQVQKLTASDAAAGDVFGLSVGIDGDAAVVGAPLDDDNEVNSGSSYVFVEVESPPPSSSTNWIFEGTAQGGEVTASINNCSVSITTVAGQSHFMVVSNFAASLNANDCLKTQGITAESRSGEVAITGASISITDFAITDPGLQHSTLTSPEFTTVDFPTAVVGGGNSTEITFVQGATATSETGVIRIYFLSPDGRTQSASGVVLAPSSTASRTFDGGDVLLVGHIETRVNSAIVATEVIRLSTGAESVSLIGVSPSRPCERPVVTLKRNPGFNTGVALSNTRPETATCSWSIHSGPESTLIATGSIALPPSGQTQSFPLNDLPIAPLPAPFEGNIQYECDVPVHAFSLLQEGDGGLVSNATSCFDGQP